MIFNNKIKNIFIAVLCFYSNCLYAQLNAETIRDAVSQDLYFSFTESKQWKQIQQFYDKQNYNPAWLNKDNLVNTNTFLDDLSKSALIGLREKDYEYTLIQTLKNGNNQLKDLKDSLQAEIQITAAALHFYNDIGFGNTTPSLNYKGIAEMPLCFDVPSLLSEYIRNKNLSALKGFLTPGLSEINLLQKNIAWYNKLLGKKDFKEIIIVSDKANSSNNSLVNKLYQFGLIQDTTIILPDSIIIKKVKQAQKQFGLLADGKLRSTTLEAFNVPIYERLQALNFSINYYRWLSCFSQKKSVIVVNIPAAYLKVYNKNKIILEMRVIVGKKSTPTPTLLSTVNEVVLYPYWHVPYSIATKELLPKLKRSASLIDAGNYQVLNRSGKIIEPYSVNWKSLSTKYFPYTIRQSTGCDNALGLLKLNFNSPGGVYLHDTPDKNFFSFNKRFLSHGCMRMENPTALGHLVLKNNRIAIDTLTQKGCLLNQAPIFVRATDAMPVLVWYNPAGVDAAGNVLFFEDVYGKFNWRKKD